MPKRTTARSVNATSSLVPAANILVKTTLPAEQAVTQLESPAAMVTCDSEAFGAGAGAGAGLGGVATGAGAETAGVTFLAAAGAGTRMRFADGPNTTSAKAAAVQRTATSIGLRRERGLMNPECLSNGIIRLDGQRSINGWRRRFELHCFKLDRSDLAPYLHRFGGKGKISKHLESDCWRLRRCQRVSERQRFMLLDRHRGGLRLSHRRFERERNGARLWRRSHGLSRLAHGVGQFIAQAAMIGFYQRLISFGFRGRLRDRYFRGGMDPLGANAEPGSALHAVAHVGEDQVLIGIDDDDIVLVELPVGHQAQAQA